MEKIIRKNLETKKKEALSLIKPLMEQLNYSPDCCDYVTAYEIDEDGIERVVSEKLVLDGTIINCKYNSVYAIFMEFIGWVITRHYTNYSNVEISKTVLTQIKRAWLVEKVDL